MTFWLVKTEKGSEIPARTSLGATTVLSVVTIGKNWIAKSGGLKRDIRFGTKNATSLAQLTVHATFLPLSQQPLATFLAFLLNLLFLFVKYRSIKKCPEIAKLYTMLKVLRTQYASHH